MANALAYSCPSSGNEKLYNIENPGCIKKLTSKTNLSVTLCNGTAKDSGSSHVDKAFELRNLITRF